MQSKLFYTLTPDIESSFFEVKIWDHGAVTGAPFLSHYALLACGPEFTTRDPDFGYALYIFWYEDKGSRLTAFWDKEKWISKAKSLIANPEFFAKKYQEWLEHQAAHETYRELLHKKEVITWDEYKKFEELHIAQFSRAFYPEYLLYADIFLAPLIEKYGQDVLSALEPTEPTFIFRYEDALLRCATSGSVSAAQIVSDFYWVRNNYRDTDVLTLESVEKEVNELKKLSVSQLQERMKGAEERIAQIEGKKESIFSLCTESEKGLLKAFALSTKWLDQRKETTLKANSLINRYLRQESLSLNIPFEDLQFLLPEELKEIIEHRKNIADFDIESRKELCAEVYANPKGISVLLKEDMSKLSVLKNTLVENVSDQRELKGQVASKGKATGRAVIVEDPSLITDFPRGSVLVAYMTRPEYVPFMKLASAIVTNEGGLTSHAAIIARELKIPCVVGTGNATVVIKDGNLVEVDATTGIVRILS